MTTKSRKSGPKPSTGGNSPDSLLDQLCKQLVPHIRNEMTAYYESGRLIDEMFPCYTDAAMTERGEKGAAKQEPKNRARYGQGLFDGLATKLGGSARSWRNRRYLYMVAKEFGLREIPQDNYLYLMEYLGNPNAYDGTWESFREKISNLINKAELEKWSAKTFKEQVDAVAGKKRTAPAPRGCDLIIRDFRSTLGAAVEKVREMAEQPGSLDLLVDSDLDIAYELANLLQMLTTKGEEAGQKFGDLVSGVKKMNTARWPGGKRAMLNKILFDLRTYFRADRIKTVCDLFGGRGHVARALKSAGYAVTVNDKYQMPHLWQWQVTECDEPVLDDDDLTVLLAECKPDPRYNWVRKFEKPHRPGVKYPVLTAGNAAVILRYLTNLAKMSEAKQKAALGLLASTVYENLAYGQEDHGEPACNQYNLSEELRKRLVWANSYVFKGSHRCHATNDDAVEHLKKHTYDLLYLDPPYAVGRDYIYSNTAPESLAQRRFVGFEEMKSPYAGNKAAAVKALQELFAVANKAAPLWILSYNESDKTLLTRMDLGQLITPYRAVLFLEIPHRMSAGQAKGSDKKTLANEYLVFCCPYMFTNHPAVVSKVRQPMDKHTSGKGTWMTPGSFVPKDKVSLKDEIDLIVWATPAGYTIEILDDLGSDCPRLIDKIFQAKPSNDEINEILAKWNLKG